MSAKKKIKKASTSKSSYFLGFKEPEWLNIIHLPNWMVFVLAMIFLFRIPTFFEPFYYGDEMIYLAIGQGLDKGLTLYKDIFDHKTPLIYYVATLAGNLFWFKVILAAWLAITTVAFYKLVSHFFSKTAVVQASVAVFAILTTLPLLEGNVVNAEAFMIGPVIFAFYLLFSKKHTNKLLLFSGMLFSVGALFKMPSIFEVIAILAFWSITEIKNKKDLLNYIKKTVIIFTGILIPFLLFAVWFSIRGALDEFIFSTFTVNFSYVVSWGQSVAEPSGYTSIFTRALLVLLGMTILYVFRRKLSKPFIFATIWLLITLFAATLSGRPYPHYLLQTVPAISILVGMLIAYPSIEQSLTVIPLSLVLITVVHFNFWYYPTFSYYQNFAEFVTNSKNKWEYFDEFSPNVEVDYKISEFLVSTSNIDDSVFVWEDTSAIYALSNRLPNIKYVANYHITDFWSLEEFYTSLRTSPPDFIVLKPNDPEDPNMRALINQKYVLLEKIEGARIYKLLSEEIQALR